MQWLGFQCLSFELYKSTGLNSTLIVDCYDSKVISEMKEIQKDNAQKDQCYTIDLIFDSYFNMPIRSPSAYNYFKQF